MNYVSSMGDLPQLPARFSLKPQPTPRHATPRHATPRQATCLDAPDDAGNALARVDANAKVEAGRPADRQAKVLGDHLVEIPPVLHDAQRQAAHVDRVRPTRSREPTADGHGRMGVPCVVFVIVIVCRVIV